MEQRTIDNRMYVHSNQLYFKPHRKYDEGLMETEDVEGRYILKVAVHETRLRNEAWLDIWYEDSEVTQHIHNNACETFYIIDGSVDLVVSGGIKTTLSEGDIFHCPPGMGHEFHTVGKHAAWFNLFSNLHYWNIVQTEIDMTTHNADKLRDVSYYRDFISSMNSPKLSPYPPILKEDDIYWVRRKDQALLNYEVAGIKLNLKVALWETNELNEIWEMEFKKSNKIVLTEPYNFWQTYIFTEGSARCKIGTDNFIALKNDFVQVHPHQPMEVEFIEDTKLLSWGSAYKLLTMLDEINYIRIKDPKKVEKAQFTGDIMRKYGLPMFEFK